MNQHIVSESRRPMPQAASIAMPETILSIVLVIAGYLALGYSLKSVTAGMTIAGYEVEWSTFASLLLAGAVIWWTKKTRGDLSSLGLMHPRSYWRGLGIGVFGAIGVYIAVALVVSPLIQLGYIAPPPEDVSDLLVSGPNASLSFGLSLALMWLNAAFCEELLFRGYLMNNVERSLGGASMWNGLAAAVVVAVVFGALHVPSQGLYGFVVTGLVGFLLGLLFLLGRRTLFPVLIAHGVINSVSLVSG